MSQRDQLNLYIRQVQQRLRLDASLRGAAVVAFAALAATVILTLILNAYAFPERGLTPARLALPGPSSGPPVPRVRGGTAPGTERTRDDADP